MTIADVVYLPLSVAYLCQDCQSVGNDAHRCPACASKALLPLARVVNREGDCSEHLPVRGVGGLFVGIDAYNAEGREKPPEPMKTRPAEWQSPQKH